MKPKIFVSSTILDFEDLRSALKFYLEELGFDVQMSEYPNFNIDSDKSAIDSCLSNLERCDYFISLIGFRRGAWYEENKLSITHKEFLTAKYLIEKGHPLRIITFVRKQLWLLKKDRDSLFKYVSSKSTELAKDINDYSSIFDDPNYIFNFINEISQGINLPQTNSPANNWLYSFEGFEDIAQALKYTFHITENLQIKRIKKLLLNELKHNYNLFLVPAENRDRTKESKEIEVENFLEYFSRHFKDKIYNSKGEPKFVDYPVEIEGKQIGFLFLYSCLYPIQKMITDLKTKIIDKCVIEGTFLDYKSEIDDFDTNLITYTINKINEWIDSYKQIMKTEVYKTFTDEITRYAYDGTAHLPYVKLSLTASGVISSLIRYSRIQPLIGALIKAIESNDYGDLISYWENYDDKIYGT